MGVEERVESAARELSATWSKESRILPKPRANSRATTDLVLFDTHNRSSRMASVWTL